MKIFFSKTSFICFNESREHYHSVLGADIGMNNGPNPPTENTHTSDECCLRVAEEILDSFTPDELLTIPWSCKFCGVFKAPADPTQFDNRAVTKGTYCACDLSAPSFYDQAVKRIQDFLAVANRINELSTEIKSKFGRQEPCLLDYKQLGVAILSPHGREGWGLVDYSWSMLDVYTKDQRDKLPLSPFSLLLWPPN